MAQMVSEYVHNIRCDVTVYEKRGSFSPIAILLVGHTVVNVRSNNPHGDGNPK
jgi:hypothetical protein